MRRSNKANRPKSGGGRTAILPPAVKGALFAAATAICAGLVSALVFALCGLRAADPAKLAPVFGLCALALSSALAGGVFRRISGLAAPIAAAVGAGIAAAALLTSLIPALPQIDLPVPKPLAAAIPIAFAPAGGALAAPRRRRRRRR